MSPVEMNVSRETIQRLEKFAYLVQKWTSRINLVSQSTQTQIWERHILDSLQLCDCSPETATSWADLGSGGGFPGLVVAIHALASGAPRRMVLVESDQRKAAFLRTVIREFGLAAEVKTERIETLAPLSADVVSARALADLSKLLEFSCRHLGSAGIALFLKGKSWQEEVAQAQENWHFDYEAIPSLTSPESVILKIAGVRRV